MKAPLLTTDRLRLVPLVKDDAPQIQAVFPQWKSCVIWRPVFRGRSRMTGVSLCEHDCFTGCRKGSAWFWTIRRLAARSSLSA